MSSEKEYPQSDLGHLSTTPFYPDNPPPYNFTECITSVPEVVAENSIDNGNTVSQSKVRLIDAPKPTQTLFMRKVYALLTGQAIIISISIVMFLYIQPISCKIAEMSGWKFWTSWTIFLICSSTFITVFDKNMRKAPLNLVLIVLVTATGGILLGSYSSYMQNMEILIDVGIIGAVCFCIVIFTLQKKLFFTPKNSIIFVWLLLIIAFGILCIIFPAYESFKIMIGPVVFCTYMVVAHHLALKDEDTDLKSHEYIYAAVSVFMLIFKFLEKVFCCCCKCHVCRSQRTVIVNM